MHTTNRPRVVLGLFAAFGIGSLIALYLAPQSGKDSRRWVTKTTKAGIGQLKNHSKRLRAQTKDWVEKGQDLATGAVQTAKQFAAR